MREHSSHRVALSLAFSALFASVAVSTPVTAQEWTRFRGPNGMGISDAENMPVKWGEKDYNWRIELPGYGHSSPVVWGQKVFLLSADPQDATRYVLCIDAATGKIVWNREYPSAPHHLHLRSSYASCTPAVDAERVYVAWATPDKTTLMALDHDGKEVWSNDLGRWVSQHGFGTSPIIYKDMVIISNSQQEEQVPKGVEPGKSFMMAFDRRSGQEIWRAPRKSGRVCYSVPCIYESAEGPQLICCNTGNGVYSLDPETGKLNWEVDSFTMRTVASPVISGDLIFGSTGSGAGGNYLVAVKPGKEIAYTIKKRAPYVPTPVTRGDLMFLCDDTGIGTCIDASTGELHWQNRLGAGFSGSPVRVRDKIYCIDESGVVHVFAADKEFQLLGENPLGEDSRATPAVSGGRMYLRTNSHLMSIGGASS